MRRQQSSDTDVTASPRSGFFRILSRTLRSRCPVCGNGRLFVPCFRAQTLSEMFLPAEKCDRCGFRFQRERGYYFGVLTPTINILALLTGAAFAELAYLVTGFDFGILMSAGLVGAAFGLILFFRPAIAIYISIDHAINPPVSD